MNRALTRGIRWKIQRAMKKEKMKKRPVGQNLHYANAKLKVYKSGAHLIVKKLLKPGYEVLVRYGVGFRINKDGYLEGVRRLQKRKKGHVKRLPLR